MSVFLTRIRNCYSPFSGQLSPLYFQILMEKRVNNGTTTEPVALGLGWIQYYSKSKRKYFYYDSISKKKQWNRPIVLSSKASSNPSSFYSSSASSRKKSPCKAPVVDNLDDPVGQLRGNIRRSMIVGGNQLGSTVLLRPWPHQMQAIEKVITSLRSSNVTGKKNQFLIQHSTGTGKSLTIAGLIYQFLQSPRDLPSYFSRVIVLVDRITLDQQLGSTLHTFFQRNGLVDVIQPAKSVEHLSSLLSLTTGSSSNTGHNNNQVIMTTIQKLSSLMDDLVKRTRLLHWIQRDNAQLAIITDEAHRSHGKEKRDGLDEMLQHFGQTGITYIGFSATPSEAAIELFRNKEGLDHVYAMEDAIKNGQILNVLEHYQCIRLDIETTIPSAIQSKLKHQHLFRHIMDTASTLPRIYQTKVEIILKDFERRRKAFPSAKCMVIARSRQDVVKYYHLLCPHEWRVYCTFSGSVQVGRNKHKMLNEQQINNINLHEADIIVVCDKLDTGFNEPKLSALYLDRKVRGSKSVQLLSRLNRGCLGKTQVAVVDFVNHPYQIAFDFAPYWNPNVFSFSNQDKDWVEYHIASSILLDFIRPDTTVDDLLMLEKDSFNQCHDALLMYHKVWKQISLQPRGLDHAQLSSLVQALALERDHLVPDDDSAAFLELTKVKMDARVSNQQMVFHGSIRPRQYVQMVLKSDVRLMLYSPIVHEEEDADADEENVVPLNINRCLDVMLTLADELNLLECYDLMSHVSLPQSFGLSGADCQEKFQTWIRRMDEEYTACNYLRRLKDCVSKADVYN